MEAAPPPSPPPPPPPPPLIIFDLSELVDAAPDLLFHIEPPDEPELTVIVHKANLLGAECIIKVCKHKPFHLLRELEFISNLHHRNLLRPLGYCTEGGDLKIVYPQLRVTLRRLLMGVCYGLGVLSWETRYSIATQLADLLVYLHESQYPAIVHNDISLDHILMDADSNPRLVSFGRATSEYTLTEPVGSSPTAPSHYGSSDIYNFGMVLLNLCCDSDILPLKDFIWMHADKKRWEAHECKVWAAYEKDKLLDIVDRDLKGNFDPLQMERLLLVGLSCINPWKRDRPKPSRIVRILGNLEPPLSIPKSMPAVNILRPGN